MRRRERIDAAIAGERPDRTPTLGGWLAYPRHVQELAGVDEAEYWADPVGVSIEAYRRLDVDALMGVFVPRAGEYRNVDAHSYKRSEVLSLDAAVAAIEAMPEPAEIVSAFDHEAEYQKIAASLRERQALCGEIIWMPAKWAASAYLSWYHDFGYETFFMIVGLYPEHARKLMRVGGARARCQSTIIARAVREGLRPKALLLGHDICDQRGPMVSPDFLEREYIPELASSIEPQLEVGCRPVWHSDGNVMPLVDMLIDAGIEGFQGFQPECGVRVEEIVRRRTRDGSKLLVFGPMAVTTELPIMTPAQVRARVSKVIEICDGEANLLLFTSNTVTPDVPLENVVAMYAHDK